MAITAVAITVAIRTFPSRASGDSKIKALSKNPPPGYSEEFLLQWQDQRMGFWVIFAILAMFPAVMLLIFIDKWIGGFLGLQLGP